MPEVPAGDAFEVARSGHVAVVTITREKRLNALDPDVSNAMSRLWEELGRDDDVWAVVLQGQGERAFSVGFDLKWAAAHPDAPVEDIVGVNGFGGLTHRRDFFKPVVAAVRGYCLGGGFELALACDLIVAAEDAVFGLPEPSVGNVAMLGGVQRLSRALPRATANRVLLAGERLSGAEAYACGLVSRTVPSERVAEEANALAERLCAASPLALQATKALALEALEMPLHEALAGAPRHPAMRRLQASDDHDEGNRAFRERREPTWTGR